MNLNELKRKLRGLKKLEMSIRFNNRSLTAKESLIWDSFFSTKNPNDLTVKYCLNILKAMDHLKLKDVFDEYFYEVYFQSYKENGMTFRNIYDPKLLSIMGLPPYATIDDIKKKYRELAKKYHPDAGGEGDKFIEVSEAYEKLKDK